MAQIQLAGSQGIRVTKIQTILIYNCYICILLIKTNSMIYICHIFYGREVEICMLTISNSEHDMGNTVKDNKDTLLDVAKGGIVWEWAGNNLVTGPLSQTSKELGIGS